MNAWLIITALAIAAYIPAAIAGAMEEKPVEIIKSNNAAVMKAAIIKELEL